MCLWKMDQKVFLFCFVSWSKIPKLLVRHPVWYRWDFLLLLNEKGSGKNNILMTFYINVASLFWNWLACFPKPTRECVCHFPCIPLGSHYWSCRLVSGFMSWQPLSVLCPILCLWAFVSTPGDARPSYLGSPFCPATTLFSFVCNSDQTGTWAVAVTWICKGYSSL